MCIHSSKLALDCAFTDLIPYTSISINPNPVFKKLMLSKPYHKIVFSEQPTSSLFLPTNTWATRRLGLGLHFLVCLFIEKRRALKNDNLFLKVD